MSKNFYTRRTSASSNHTVIIQGKGTHGAVVFVWYEDSDDAFATYYKEFRSHVEAEQYEAKLIEKFNQ